MYQPRTADLRPHFSLLARTMELVHGDKRILNDLYTFVVHVQAIKYPTFNDFNSAFETVLQSNNMRRTTDTFYTNFLTSVIDINKRGYHISEAYASALNMYMDARAAAIFSRLRKLFRGLKGLKTAKRIGVRLYYDDRRSFNASTYLPSPSPSPSSIIQHAHTTCTGHPSNSRRMVHGRPSSAVTFRNLSNRLSSDLPTNKDHESSQKSPSRSKSLFRKPRMLTSASNALVELDDSRILRAAFYALLTNYKNRMYSAQKEIVKKSTTERLLYIECIIKQRTVAYILSRGFQTWRKRQQDLQKIYKTIKRHNKNFIMLCSLLMRMSIQVFNIHGMTHRDRVISTVIAAIFHLLLDKHHTILSQTSLAYLHYDRWSARYLKKRALSAMLTRHVDLHKRLSAPYAYLDITSQTTVPREHPIGCVMQTITGRNLARRALAAWKGRLQSLQLSFSLMLRVRDKLLLSISFFCWRKVHGYHTLLSCFATTDANKLLSRAFNAWRQRYIAFMVTARHNPLHFKDAQIQRTVLADLHRKLVYVESLGNSFMCILQNRRLILILREWRYALLLHRMERITAVRHNQFLLRQSMSAWRSELLAYRFGLLLDTPYNCSGSYFIKAPPNKPHPTYASLALLALGAMIGDMRSEILDKCPTLRTIKKIVGLSDYYRHDTRPLKYLKDIDINCMASQLAPDSRRHVLTHCFRRWQLFSLMEADKHKNQLYLETKYRRQMLHRVFQAIKGVARRSYRIARAQELLFKKLRHKVLIFWRKGLMEKRLIEYMLKKHQLNLLAWTFRAWKLKVSIYAGLNLFAATLPSYNKELYDSVMDMLRRHDDPQAIVDHLYSVLTKDPSCPQTLLDALDDCLKLGQRGTLVTHHAVSDLRDRSVTRQMSRNLSIIISIFNNWRLLCALRQEQFEDAISYDKKRLLRRFFWHWFHVFSVIYEQKSLAKGDFIYKIKLLRHAFMIWNFLAMRLKNNDSFISNKYLMYKAYTNLQFGAKIIRFQAKRNSMILHKCIHSWHNFIIDELCHSQILFERYLQRRAIRTWLQRLLHLNRAETDLTLWMKQRTVSLAFREWFLLFCKTSAADIRLENTWRARLALTMLHNLAVARRRGYTALQDTMNWRLCAKAFCCFYQAYNDAYLERVAIEYAQIKDCNLVHQTFTIWIERYREQNAKNSALVMLFRKRFYLRALLKRTRQERNRHIMQEMWVERLLVKMAFFEWRDQYIINQEILHIQSETLKKHYLIRIWYLHIRTLSTGIMLLEERKRTQYMLKAYTVMWEQHQRLDMCYRYINERYRRDLLSRILASWCQAKLLNKHYDTQQRTRFYRLVRRWKRTARENAIYRVQEKRALEWRNRKLLFYAFSELKVRALTFINKEALISFSQDW